ncbi:MAG: Ig-like domain-containing protein [Terriglobales bacterium]
MRWGKSSYSGRPVLLALPVVLSMLAALGLSACAGNGEGLDQNGQPIGSSSGGSSSGGSTPLTADFQSIQDNVFTPICSKCHIGASAPEGLQLDAAHSYNLLVGVPSVEDSSLLRVDPGNPDMSYMVLKIEGAPGIVGGQMPLGEAPLPQATIDAIRAWVSNGAMNAPASSLAGAIMLAAGRSFAVESTAPVDQAIVTGPLPQVVVAFTHDLDASLVNTTTVALERLDSAPSASQDPGVVIGVARAAHNPAVLLITPAAPLEAGRYRVTLRGTGGAALADEDATTLGTDVAFEFTVEAAP